MPILFTILITRISILRELDLQNSSFLKTLTDDDTLIRRVSIACYEAEVNVVILMGVEGYIFAWYDENVTKVSGGLWKA